MASDTILEVKSLDAFYGNVQVLRDVSLVVGAAEIVALVGANGAGKTTLLKSISGQVPPRAGTIEFQGRSIGTQPPHCIVDLGISQVPEGGRPFPEMTVHENLDLGAYPRRAWKDRGATLEQVYGIFPRLEERVGSLARTLSGGERQMLAIGRAMMSKPSLVMFDEPSYGLAPMMVAEAFRVVQSLRDHGLTVLLVEQNVRQTLEIADRAYVLENGRILLQGTGAALLDSEHVRRAYLGR